MKLLDIAWRVFYDSLCLISIVWGPWWLTILLLIFGIYLFRYYVEIIIAGVLIDMMYSLPSFRAVTVPYVTLVSVVVYWGVSIVTQRMR